MHRSLWKVLPIVLVLFWVITAVTPTVQADEWNKKTYLTFSGPVEIPNGKILPQGKYVFKLADSQSNRHIVQIFDEDEKHIQATILAIPNERLTPTDKTVVTFWEMPAGQPTALRAWFYPGDNFGQEFAYPKNRAEAISTATNQHVPELTEQDQEMLSKQPEGPVTGGEIAQNEPPANTPPAPAEQAAPPSTPATQQPMAPADRNNENAGNNRLPQTGSYLPLTALAGLFSLGAAFGLRGVVKFLR